MFTDGLYTGSSKEIADIFQEDLKRSEWAEVEDHANIPLIGFTPWSVLADRSQLMGIFVSKFIEIHHISTVKCLMDISQKNYKRISKPVKISYFIINLCNKCSQS